MSAKKNRKKVKGEKRRDPTDPGTETTDYAGPLAGNVWEVHVGLRIDHGQDESEDSHDDVNGDE